MQTNPGARRAIDESSRHRNQATAGDVCEAAKARLLKLDEDQAAAALDKLVVEHSAAAHVEDAKDRLVAMGRPVPTPTPEQIAASTALEAAVQ